MVFRNRSSVGQKVLQHSYFQKVMELTSANVITLDWALNELCMFIKLRIS